MGQAQVLDLFQGIYGVGPKIALKWYRQGLRTLDDVRKRTDLTENQRVSLDHYADFQERIPRVEVAEHFDVVRKACEQLDPDVQPYLMGSYRRGQPDCGDIDIILMKPGKGRKDLCAFLYELLSKLFDQDFAKYTFGGYEADSPRWMGATCLPKTNKWRRLDILLVPWGERAGAFIYYTGNEIFNRSIRLLADRKGYHLNEKGLFVKGPAKHQHGPLVEGEDEKRIFEILKVPYREPTERNIS
jgi:DNA polymerase IV